MRSLFLVSILFSALSFSSCSDDDSPSFSSSATLTVDGIAYTKSSDSEIAFLEVTFNDVTTYSMGGDMVNGTDTVNFSVSIPTLSETTYTKAANGDEASISISVNSITTGSNRFTSNEPIFGDDQDFTDYSLTIEAVTDDKIIGRFSGTLQNTFGEETKEVSGTFEAIDLAAFFEGF